MSQIAENNLEGLSTMQLTWVALWCARAYKYRERHRFNELVS